MKKQKEKGFSIGDYNIMLKLHKSTKEISHRISVACGKAERPIYLYEQHSSWYSVYRHVYKDKIKHVLRLCQV
jgi:hypothetical protein